MYLGKYTSAPISPITRRFSLLCPPSFVLWAPIEMDLDSLLGPFDADQDEIPLFWGQSTEVPVLKRFHPRTIEDDLPYGVVAVHASPCVQVLIPCVSCFLFVKKCLQKWKLTTPFFTMAFSPKRLFPREDGKMYATYWTFEQCLFGRLCGRYSCWQNSEVLTRVHGCKVCPPALRPSSVLAPFCPVQGLGKSCGNQKRVSLLQAGLSEGAFGSIVKSTNRFPLSTSHVSKTTILHQDGACLSSTPCECEAKNFWSMRRTHWKMAPYFKFQKKTFLPYFQAAPLIIVSCFRSGPVSSCWWFMLRSVFYCCCCMFSGKLGDWHGRSKPGKREQSQEERRKRTNWGNMLEIRRPSATCLPRKR